jgi:cytochrome c biogenesis protein CcmG, thiol:disulfide interchange protein DsbE
MKWTFAGLMLSISVSASLAVQPGEAVDVATLSKMQVDPGKVTVIDFFAEWCVSCRKELPLLSAVHGRSDPKKIEFIGVATDESSKVAEAFQKEMRDKGGLSFRVVNDPSQTIVKSFKPKGYPALYILKDGKVVRSHLGAVPNIDVILEKELKALGVY